MSDLERLSDEARARKSAMPEWLKEFAKPEERKPSTIEQLASDACQICEGTGSGGMGLGCTDCLGTGRDPSAHGCENGAETDAEKPRKKPLKSTA